MLDVRVKVSWKSEKEASSAIALRNASLGILRSAFTHPVFPFVRSPHRPREFLESSEFGKGCNTPFLAYVKLLHCE